MLISMGSQFSEIINFFKNIGQLCSSLVAVIPDFLRPVALGFIVISAIYLIAGRN